MISSLSNSSPGRDLKRTWLLIALANFLIAASLGALLRFAFVEELSWMQYKNVQHAHSHVAMLGWVYQALFALLIHTFGVADKFYNRLFWITQLTVVGMLISFPIQGYGPLSIAFSTLHILCSYVFVRRFWQRLAGSKTDDVRFIKTALVFLLLSTVGLWAMGPLMGLGFRGSAIYYMAVQFYLHFQFNGWFLFAVLGIFLHVLNSASITLPPGALRRFHGFLVVSCLFTYALAVAWSQPYLAIFVINSAGVIVQLIALLLFLRLVWPHRQRILAMFERFPRALLKVTFWSFTLKICIQAMIVVPWIAQAGYTIRNFVIGFIHLILLGAVTMFLLAYAAHRDLLSIRSVMSRIGIGLILTGFITSELILFLQGTMLWGAMGFLPGYYFVIFTCSACFPAGIVVFLSSQFRTKRRTAFTSN